MSWQSRVRVGKVRWMASLRVESPDDVSCPSVFICKGSPPSSQIATFLPSEHISVTLALIHCPPFCILTGSLVASMV